MFVVIVACFIGLAIVQGCVVYVCRSRRIFPTIRRTRSAQLGMFLVAQVVIVFMFVSGTILDKPLYDFAQEVLATSHPVPPMGFEVSGDPSLLAFVDRRQPALPRPILSNADEFLQWQGSLRRRLLEVFQLSDVAQSNVVQVHMAASSVVVPNIRRTSLTLKSFDGTDIPGYLFTPARSGKKAAILVLHGHVPEQSGGIAQTAGMVASYQHGAALELAKAGYVTLTIEFRGFGDLGSRIGTEHRLVAYNAILGGSFYKAVVSKDIKSAVDFLHSLDDVDPRRIGVTGVSYGGEMAVTYAALDERIAVVVSQGFGGQVGRQQGIVGTRHDQPHYCHIIPGGTTYMQQEDVFLLIAPRPLLGIWGNKGYAARVHDAFPATVQRAYGTLNVDASVQFKVVEGRHEYFVEPAIEFFNRFL